MKTDFSSKTRPIPSGQFINLWLARWLIAAAENPEEVEAEVVEHHEDGLVIELQDKNGIPVGGVLLTNALGHLHVLARLDSNDDSRYLPWTLEDMLIAQQKERKRKERGEKYAKFGQFCLFGAIPLVIIVMLMWLVRFLIG